jgi:hypothetical protein
MNSMKTTSESLPGSAKLSSTKQLFEKMKKKWVLIAVIAVALLIIIRLIVAGSTSTQPASSNSSTSNAYQVFSDNKKYFYIKVPSTWTTTQTVATETTGLHTANPKTQDIEISQLYLPDQLGVTVQVYEGTPDCPLSSPINSTLAGYPASYNQAAHRWIVPTTVGNVVLSIAYPGSGGFHEPAWTVSPTPVPQELTTEDQLLLKNILSTFTPINLVPFNCGNS